MARKSLGKAATGSTDLITRADALALLGRHAKFTGTTNLAFTINLGATQTVAMAVTPVVTGDSLAAQEDISIQTTGPLPGGINIAYAYVSAANTVTIGFTSSALLSLNQTVAWRVTAHR